LIIAQEVLANDETSHELLALSDETAAPYSSGIDPGDDSGGDGGVRPAAEEERDGADGAPALYLYIYLYIYREREREIDIDRLID